MALSEEAYFYDLCVVPGWREFFDRLIDEEVKLPAAGRVLEVECGSGGLAIDLALRGGREIEVLGVDPLPELVSLAREKARIHKAARVSFSVGTLSADPSELLPDGRFDLVIADNSLVPWRSPSFSFDDLARVTAPGGTVVLKSAGRGSFDEVFSIFWESLYDLDLLDASPALEALIESRPLVADLEAAAREAGLRQVRSYSRPERLAYPTGSELFDAPLIRTVFLDYWLSILPDQDSRPRVVSRMAEIIDRERRNAPFDLTVRAAIVLARKTAA